MKRRKRNFFWLTPFLFGTFSNFFRNSAFFCLRIPNILQNYIYQKQKAANNVKNKHDAELRIIKEESTLPWKAKFWVNQGVKWLRKNCRHRQTEKKNYLGQNRGKKKVEISFPFNWLRMKDVYGDRWMDGWMDG